MAGRYSKQDDVKSLHRRWEKERDSYCYVHEFVIE